MARSQASATQSKSASKRKAASPADKYAQKGSQAKGAGKSAPRNAPTTSLPESAPTMLLIDEQSRRSILGVVCVVCALVLFIITAMPATGIVSSWLSGFLHAGLGLGAYLLPFLLFLQHPSRSEHLWLWSLQPL